MTVFDKARLIIYRCHEKGIEIFLMGSDDTGSWRLPDGDLGIYSGKMEDKIIELDPIDLPEGGKANAVAIEGDWHDIPSIRALIREDIDLVKEKIKEFIPKPEGGTFVAMKEAFKKVLPDEYAFLKELKDILIDRNLVKNI
jgi:hypothetical protein